VQPFEGLVTRVRHRRVDSARSLAKRQASLQQLGEASRRAAEHRVREDKVAEDRDAVPASWRTEQDDRMDGTSIREAAIALVQADGGVRVEDYLTALGAATGEAALAAAGFEVVGHELAPGSALFYEPVDQILGGDRGMMEGSPAASIVGILRGWIPDLVGAADFPTPDSLYRHVASTVGQAPWGEVAVTVGDDNRPSLSPLRAAFELRPAVLAAEAALGTAPSERHLLAANALLEAGHQVAGAIDHAVAVRLALEVVWGMAKMAPMTPAAFDATVG
jgi:hypothetical protein